jgi:NhaA family Na+:H+ antiporter
MAAAVGFTVALFFATAAFRPGPVLDEAKMGALMSFIAAPLAIGLGRLVGISPGRQRAPLGSL